MMILIKGFLLISMIMTFLWIVQHKTKNATWVDVGWTGGIVFLAIYYFLSTGAFNLRTFLFVSMVIIWGARLLIHLWKRILREVREDARYQVFRDRWGDSAPWKFFGMFQFQAVLAWLLSAPLLSVFSEAPVDLGMTEWAALSIWLFALIGETSSDRALQLFKSDPMNHAKVCRKGWWAYSRHPNYFFESCIWISYAIYAVRSPYGLSVVFSALLILFLVLRVSGIPLAEAQSMKSRPDAYRLYQKEVSAFFPWFPKRNG